MTYKYMTKILSISVALLALSLPAQAATQRSADFAPGNTVGIGLFGLSYDYGLGPVSLGLDTNSSSNYSFSPYGTRLKFSSRVLWRVMETETITGAAIVAAHYDPGEAGGTDPQFVPEAGFSMAYRIWDSPFLIRLNATVGYHSGRQANPWLSVPTGEDSTEPLPEPHFFQKIGMGPGTSFELAYQPDENSEITLGGGSWVGMRLKF